MRNVAIKKICSKLHDHYKVDLGNMVVLDFFARAGDWQTQYFAKRVKKVYAWEIDSKFEKDLRENLPANSDITIGNSFDLAKNKNNFFDMVVLDNPQGCYGDNNSYCEHFEALPLIFTLLREEGGVVIFNMKTQPFSYSDKREWQARRNEFYNLSDCSNLKKDFVFAFYQEFFKERGYETEFMFWEKRPQEDGLYAVTARLRKVIYETD